MLKKQVALPVIFEEIKLDSGYELIY